MEIITVQKVNDKKLNKLFSVLRGPDSSIRRKLIHWNNPPSKLDLAYDKDERTFIQKLDVSTPQKLSKAIEVCKNTIEQTHANKRGETQKSSAEYWLSRLILENIGVQF